MHHIYIAIAYAAERSNAFASILAHIKLPDRFYTDYADLHL